jgi:tetratricopeptide (TPR) repeat protein
MKKYLFVAAMLCLSFTVYGQQVDEEKVNKAVAIMKKMISNPDQMMALYQEMEALKLTSAEEAEAQKRIEKGAIEQASQIKKQVTAISGVTEQQVKQKMEDGERIAPLRNEKRINSVLKRTLTDAEVKQFCKTVHERITGIMFPQALQQSEEVHRQLRANPTFTTDMGNTAVLLYLSNLTQQSLYTLGRVCSETNADANTLNNYATLLNHFNLQEAAIPILNNLRKKHGITPPVMNNLAVAWFGLGDVKTAAKYADTVIQRFPGRRGHAHYIKSVIKEGEGDKAGAIEELEKSIDESYSQEKETLLRKWNGNTKRKNFRLKQVGDVMGLEEFTIPDFPSNYEEHLKLKPVWEAFHKNLKSAAASAEQTHNRLRSDAEKKQAQVVKDVMQKGAVGYAFAVNNNVNLAAAYYYDAVSEKYAEADREWIAKEGALRSKIELMKKDRDKEIEKAMEPFKNTCGEGQPCPEKEICEAQKKVEDAFLSKMRPVLQNHYQEINADRKYYINQMMNASRYSMDETWFPVEQAKEQWFYLEFLKSIDYIQPGSLFSLDGKPKCIDANQNNPFKSKGLPDFDEVNCKPDWQIGFPGGSKLSTHCNTIELELDFQAFTFGFKENIITGEWTNMTFEVGTDISLMEKLGIPTAPAGDNGPKIDAYAGVSGFVEVEKSGVQSWDVKDAGVKGKAGVSAGGRIIEMEKKISIMSGKPDFSTGSEFKSDFGILVLPFK